MHFSSQTGVRVGCRKEEKKYIHLDEKGTKEKTRAGQREKRQSQFNF
jgi:hypothetical protein